MKIVLIGYGKMGQAIDRLATERGHEITAHIEANVPVSQRMEIFRQGDVAIEFSHPEAAFDNIVEALKSGIPVVSGTTGWLSSLGQVHQLVAESQGSFFYASNFSIGVNMIFALNEHLAKMMNSYSEYEVSVDEVHHIHKKDAPSGTAISLANGIIDHLDRKSGWSLDQESESNVRINARREGEVFGDHKVVYASKIDRIEISHTAYSRDGFAIGALLAAQWIYNNGDVRPGVYSMKDLMSPA